MWFRMQPVHAAHTHGEDMGRDCTRVDGKEHNRNPLLGCEPSSPTSSLCDLGKVAPLLCASAPQYRTQD